MNQDVAVVESLKLKNTGCVVAGVSTRIGGVSGEMLGMNLSFRVGDDPELVRENRRLFLSHLGLSEDRLALPSQVHGNKVLRVDTPGLFENCDALVTDSTGVVLGISIADCVPILLCDPVRHAIGAVHAGWRGTAAGIAQVAVEAMKEHYQSLPENITAFVGPCASVCCYAVGEEVSRQFPAEVVSIVGKQQMLDLKQANCKDLEMTGVLPRNIEVSSHCTISDSELFHSHRRDGSRSGRMMAVITLT